MKMYRKFHGSFPKAMLDKCIVEEKMKEKMIELSHDPLKSKRKRKQIFKGVDVTPYKNEGVLSDFFVNPNEIPQSKKEALSEFMKVPRSYESIIQKLRELDEDA